MTKRVSFATVDQMPSVRIETTTAEMEETPPVKASVTGSRETSPVPPPGFRPFEWPDADWIKNGELQRDPGLKFVASWSAKIAEEEMSSPPPLETLSPIPMADGQDSITVQVGTTDSEPVRPRSTNSRDQLRRALETLIRCLDGGWPVKDHFRTNVRRPLFVFWGKAALSDTLHINRRTTPDRRVVSGFR